MVIEQLEDWSHFHQAKRKLKIISETVRDLLRILWKKRNIGKFHKQLTDTCNCHILLNYFFSNKELILETSL